MLIYLVLEPHREMFTSLLVLYLFIFSVLIQLFKNPFSVCTDAMFNEPEEYEDLPLKGSSSVEEKDNQCHNSTCEFQYEMTRKNDNDSTVGLDFSPQSLSPSKKTSTNIRDR